jgi:hypothetical protein
LLLLVLNVPSLREPFHFSALHRNALAICLGAELLSVLSFEGSMALGGRSGATVCYDRPGCAGEPQGDVGAIKKLAVVETPLG